MSDFRVTYTPGSGYSAYLPGFDRPMIHFGSEYRAMVMEKAAQYAAQHSENKPKADRFHMGDTLMPSYYDPLDTSERKKLTKDELTELASDLSSRYDPTNMTQEQYDSFLFELVDHGILSENDLGPMGLHGLVSVGSFAPGGMCATDGFFGGVCRINTETLHNDPYYQKYGLAYSLFDTKGNVLAYAKLMAYQIPANGDAGWMRFAEKRQHSFEAMADVLDAMQKHRDS